MRTHEKRMQERMVEVSHTCDFCGASLGLGYFDQTEAVMTIRAKEGKVYPEGGRLDCFEAEACEKCFRDKIIPALRALGLRAEVDWRDVIV